MLVKSLSFFSFRNCWSNGTHPSSEVVPVPSCPIKENEWCEDALSLFRPPAQFYLLFVCYVTHFGLQVRKNEAIKKEKMTMNSTLLKMVSVM